MHWFEAEPTRSFADHHLTCCLLLFVSPEQPFFYIKKKTTCGLFKWLPFYVCAVFGPYFQFLPKVITDKELLCTEVRELSSSCLLLLPFLSSMDFSRLSLFMVNSAIVLVPVQTHFSANQHLMCTYCTIITVVTVDL